MMELIRRKAAMQEKDFGLKFKLPLGDISYVHPLLGATTADNIRGAVDEGIIGFFQYTLQDGTPFGKPSWAIHTLIKQRQKKNENNKPMFDKSGVPIMENYCSTAEFFQHLAYHAEAMIPLSPNGHTHEENMTIMHRNFLVGAQEQRKKNLDHAEAEGLSDDQRTKRFGSSTDSLGAYLRNRYKKHFTNA